jgi:hypothetical protein
MAYDRADWHSGGDFPEGLPDDNGGTHIGFFLAWAIHRGLEGEMHREDSADELRAVRERKMTGREFLFRSCDGKFWDDDLSDEGNAFASDYYEERYVADYEETLGDDLESIYEVEESWANFDRLAPVLDRRFAEWKSKR